MMSAEEQIDALVEKVDNIIDRLALDLSDIELQMLATRIAALFELEVIPERIFARSAGNFKGNKSSKPYHKACDEIAEGLVECWLAFHEANPARSKTWVPSSVTDRFIEEAVKASDELRDRDDDAPHRAIYERAKVLMRPHRAQW